MSAPIRCTRCGRRLRGNAEAWNAQFEAGRIVAVICPSCQSPAENAEAEINDATLNYRTTVEHGRLEVRAFPKAGGR